jgi:hypothetical protein
MTLTDSGQLVGCASLAGRGKALKSGSDRGLLSAEGVGAMATRRPERQRQADDLALAGGFMAEGVDGLLPEPL